MTGFETARTVRYEGSDREEAERAFTADSPRALAAGYTVVRTRWDDSGPRPALVVEYRYASQTELAPGTSAAGHASARRHDVRSGQGGLGEAVLIAGVILAVILVLAAVIPAAAPPATSAPPAVASPIASPTPTATQSP